MVRGLYFRLVPDVAEMSPASGHWTTNHPQLADGRGFGAGGMMVDSGVAAVVHPVALLSHDEDIHCVTEFVYYTITSIIIGTNGPTNIRTDRPTDQVTAIPSCREMLLRI